MSEEDLEIVRRFIGYLSELQYDAAAEWLAPDAKWHNTSVFPGPTTVTGVEVIAEFLRDLFESYRGGEAGVEVEELIDGGELAVVGLHGWGHGLSSGVPIDARWAHTIACRDGKVVRVDTFGHLSKALEAAGRSDGSPEA
jgi:ketosteroid isomerase-like protein